MWKRKKIYPQSSVAFRSNQHFYPDKFQGISSRVDCAIKINFNIDAVDKGGSCYIENDLSPSKSFILGTMCIHFGVNKT